MKSTRRSFLKGMATTAAVSVAFLAFGTAPKPPRLKLAAGPVEEDAMGFFGGEQWETFGYVCSCDGEGACSHRRLGRRA